MLSLKTTSKFRKDYKRIKRRGYQLILLEEVIQTLLEGASLDPKHLDHPLTGNYTGFRECHIEPDWLLIYKIEAGQLLLIASRTGTHSDLFG